MSQLLKPKPLPEKPFEIVELVYGKGWQWKISTRFGFGIRAGFDKIQSDECFSWLQKTMNEAQIQKSESLKDRERKSREELGIPPSQLLPEESFGRILSTAIEQQIIIPTDEDVQKHIRKFTWYRNDEVRNRQLDLLLTPIDNAPPASSIINEADPESVGSVFTYFFDVVNPKEEEPSQTKDSGANAKSSEKTHEASTSKQKEKIDS